jgi:hypothetical protein
MNSTPATNTGLLYVIYEAGNVGPALDLCATLQANRAVRCILYCPYYLPDTEAYIQRARALGVAYVHEATALGGDALVHEQLQAAGFPPVLPHAVELPKPIIQWQAFALYLLRWMAKDLADAVCDWISHYRTRLEIARSVLHRLNASRVILPEDNVERDSACWTTAIHSRGGRSQVISYGSVTPHEFALAYWGNPEHAIRSKADRFFSIVRPRWKMTYSGRSLHRLPTARAIAMELLGLAPARPWVVNTGRVDDILVESEFMRDLFTRHGIARRRIQVTGTAPLDALASMQPHSHTSRLELLQQLGCDPAKKVLVCAMPPNQYPGRKSPGFSSYAELVRAWSDALAAGNDYFNLIISPHPSMSEQDLACLQAMGGRIQLGSVMNLLPLADLYVASVSSTIKWALACGKPVVNYDCYQYHYSDYAGIAQVHTVHDASDSRALLKRFTEPEFLTAQTKVARERAAYFGSLDGHAKQRMTSILLD